MPPTATEWRRALAILALVVSIADTDADAANRPLTWVTASVAPGRLGQLTGTGLSLIATTSEGRELMVFDSATWEIRRFLETGAQWGDSTHLDAGWGTKPQVFALAVADDGDIALLGGEGIEVFDSDGASRARRPILWPSDVVTSERGWLVSLMNVPHPSGTGYLGRKEFGEEVPALLRLDADLEFDASGLVLEGGMTDPDVAAGVRLQVAAATDRVYTMEISNYRIQELGFDLEPRSSYSDPELFFAQARRPDHPNHEKVEREAAASMAVGIDLAGSGKPPKPPVSGAFTTRVVVQDLAWEDSLDRLVILLDRGVGSSGAALDLLDPATGAVQRIGVRLPENVKLESPLSQLAIGRRYAWLRSRTGTDPLLRISRQDLALARPAFELPETQITATAPAE